MTRKEFAKAAMGYATAKNTPLDFVIADGQSLVDYYTQLVSKGTAHTSIGKALSVLLAAVGEVATNGFTPEPETNELDVHAMLNKAIDAAVYRSPYIGKPLTDRAFRDAVIAQNDSPKPPARPFIGSHKLPYDSDWD